MALEYYHEPVQQLPVHVVEEHRAIASLIEELEAAHWYSERMSATQDTELRSVLEHNRDEELEHAAMLIEWLRRNIPQFNTQIQTYLNTTAPITSIEEAAEENGSEMKGTSVMQAAGGDLGNGSMRTGE
jgi:ferritin-like protein